MKFERRKRCVCVFITAVPLIKLSAWGEGESGGHVQRETTSRSRCGPGCPGTHEEPGTLTQGVALFSLVPLVWESNPKLQGGWCSVETQCLRQHPPSALSQVIGTKVERRESGVEAQCLCQCAWWSHSLVHTSLAYYRGIVVIYRAFFFFFPSVIIFVAQILPPCC